MATATSILGIALLLLVTPIWTHFALGAAGSAAPGPPGAAVQASDQTVGHLLTLGDFSIAASDGSPMYTDDERSHMRDVQLVLYVFLALAAAALLFVALNVASSPGPSDFRAIARGGAGLAIGVVVLGAVGLVAFDVAFEAFHRIVFPGGNWSFPSDSNLIRLYPVAFWQLSAAALGVLAVLGGALTWAVARSRAAAPAA
jgi:hypothetical protein